MFGWAQWAFVQEWVSMRFYFELVLVPCRCLYWQNPVLSLCTTCAKSNMGTRSHQVFVWSEVNATEADTSTSTALIMSVCMSVCIVLCISLELPLYIVLSHCANIHGIRQTDMSYGHIFLETPWSSRIILQAFLRALKVQRRWLPFVRFSIKMINDEESRTGSCRKPVPGSPIPGNC